jgi:hypothetical protein
MARYFNKTRGPVNVSLRDGSPLFIGRKATVDIEPEQDGSASLHAAVRRGLLTRLKEKAPRPEPEKQVPVVAPPPPPPTEPEEAPEEDGEAPSMNWKKSDLVEHAESLGLEVPASWTKVEILEAIEGAE